MFFFPIKVSAQEAASNSALRKQLFILERSLSRKAEGALKKPLRDFVLSGYEPKLPDRIDPAGGSDDGKNGAGNSSKGAGAAGAEKKEPGSVSVSLGGGDG